MSSSRSAALHSPAAARPYLDPRSRRRTAARGTGVAFAALGGEMSRAARRASSRVGSQT
jgi:hypothetical protein